jgi:putative transcriptional regulator
MDVTWKLRMAAAQREVWTGAQLRRLLAERAGVEMSAASVSALMRQAPKQLKLSTLQALCVALDCQPGDLIEIDTTPVAKPAPGGKHARQQSSRGQTRSRTPPPF